MKRKMFSLLILMSLLLSVCTVTKSEAKGKTPRLSVTNPTIKVGESVKLKVVPSKHYAFVSSKFDSVKVYLDRQGVNFTLVGCVEGISTLKIVVKHKRTKQKYTLSTTVKVV